MNVSLSDARAAGALLVVAILPLALGISLFLGRNGVRGGAPDSPALFALERVAIVTAVLLTVLGLELLGAALRETDARVLALLGTRAYFFGALLLAVAEVARLPASQSPYPLIVSYVVLALLSQAVIGIALVQSGMLPAWIGWIVVAWNLSFLIILPITTPGDMYFPILHHLMPLLIGVTLLQQ